MPQKHDTTTVKLGTVFEKNCRRIVILKIVGATPQLDQNFLSPQEISREFFLYRFKYIHVYCFIYLKMKKLKVDFDNIVHHVVSHAVRHTVRHALGSTIKYFEGKKSSS